MNHSSTGSPHHHFVHNLTLGAEDEEEVSQEIHVLMTTMVSLVVGSLFAALPKRVLEVIPVVYVVLLFVMCLTLVLILCGVHLKQVFGPLLLEDSNSEFLQSLYLPPLIFSEVFKLNLRTFRVAFWQVMWLIIPGVIFGAILTALFPLYLLPSGPPYFSVYESLSFGGALSTTDPIAVLMVLHEIGAPARLKALVGGESLLNDATSIIFVKLFLLLNEGARMDAGSIFVFCLRETLLGPLFGLLAGAMTILAMRQLEDEVVPLISLSFACPYVAFVVCNTYLESSGVLCLVSMGLVINRFGRAFLNRHMEHVEAFWDQVEFFATCLLYTQTGIYVAEDLNIGSIMAIDWLSLMCLFLWITLVRALMILLSYPFLSRVGYSLDWKDAVVMVHSGLRGGVSILLSFTIAASPGTDERTSSLTLFLVAGVVVLMCFNVVTTGPLCRLLGLQFNKNQPVYRHLQGLLSDSTVMTLHATGLKRQDIPPEFTMHQMDSPLNKPVIDTKASMCEKRAYLSLAFKTTFEALLETKLIKRVAWFTLVTAIEALIDKQENIPKLITWDDVLSSGTFRTLAESYKLACCRKEDDQLRAFRLLFSPEEIGGRLAQTDTEEGGSQEDLPDILGAVEHLTFCAIGLIIAHERCRRILKETFASPASGDMESIEELLEESKECCQAPATFINQVFAHFPKVISKIKMHHARAQVHRKNIALIGDMRRKGIVNDAVLKQLINEVEHLDEMVSKVEFPLSEPLNVGVRGETLSRNPNFGPFSIPDRTMMMHRQTSDFSSPSHQVEFEKSVTPQQQQKQMKEWFSSMVNNKVEDSSFQLDAPAATTGAVTAAAAESRRSSLLEGEMPQQVLEDNREVSFMMEDSAMLERQKEAEEEEAVDEATHEMLDKMDDIISSKVDQDVGLQMNY